MTPEELQTESRRLLFSKGIFSWALHSDQRLVNKSVRARHAKGARRFVLMCGRRWGKTRYMVVDAFTRAMAAPNQRILYAALTWTSCVNFVMPEVAYLLQYAPKDNPPVVVGGEIRFPNGSVIILKGAEDELKANRLRGSKAHWAYVDEAGFIDILPYLINSVIAAQLLTTDGSVVIASSPPLSAGHPFVGFVEESEIAETLARRTSYDAPHVSRKVLENLCAEMGGPETTAWKREFMCITGDSMITIRTPEGEIKTISIKELNDELSESL